MSEETWEERIERERAFSHAKYSELYRGVAQFLDGWVAHIAAPKDEPKNYSYHLVNDLMKIDLSIQPHGKVRVSGYWPKRDGRYGSYTSPRDVSETSTEIYCSVTRGYEAIAKDIKRRFLPEYLRIWNKIQEKIAMEVAYANRKAINWAKLTDADLVVNPRGNSKDNEELRGDLKIGSKSNNGSYDYDKSYGDVRMSGDNSVEIKLHSLPIDVAMRVIKALNGE